MISFMRYYAGSEVVGAGNTDMLVSKQTGWLNPPVRELAIVREFKSRRGGFNKISPAIADMHSLPAPNKESRQSRGDGGSRGGNLDILPLLPRLLFSPCFVCPCYVHSSAWLFFGRKQHHHIFPFFFRRLLHLSEFLQVCRHPVEQSLC